MNSESDQSGPVGLRLGGGILRLVPFAIAIMGLAVLAITSTAAGAMPAIGVPDSGDPLVNGEALIRAIEEAPGLNPSAANPVIIDIAAGSFDIDGASVTLPDGVDLVGAGSAETTICHCARHAAPVVDVAQGTWFVSPGANRVQGVTLTRGGGVVFNSSGGDLIMDDVDVIYARVPETGQKSPSLLATVSGGRVAFLNSSLSGSGIEGRARGIVASGSASITIESSTARLTEYAVEMLRIEDGRLEITDSTLSQFSYDSGSLIRATGAPQVSIAASTINAAGGDYGSENIVLSGGSLDIVGSELTGGSGFACLGCSRAVVARSAAVSIQNSELKSKLEIVGGVLNLTATDITPEISASVALDLDGVAGSMTGGSIAYRSEENDGSVADVLKGTGSIVFDGVMMTNSRLSDDPGARCVDTINNDVIYSGPGASDEVIATQTPPLGCSIVDSQTAYPAGSHSVPGSIEAEDYDEAPIAGISFADRDTGNFNGAYRRDDVDVWPTYGEPGFTVGRTSGGEWLEYTFDAADAGEYEVGVRLATGFADPGAIRVSIDGAIVGTIDDVPIDGWWSFSTASAGTADLAAGPHVLRLDILGNGEINLDRIDVTIPVEGPACAGLAQQGVTGLISGSMRASATAIGSAPGTPNKYGEVDGADYVEYCVTASTAGIYELDTVVKAPDVTMNSFFVEVNNAAPVTWHIPATAVFAPRFVGGAVPTEFTLDVGDNIVRFYHRERGTELAAFEFRLVDAQCAGPLRQFAAEGVASGAMVVTPSLVKSVDGTPNKYTFDGSDFVEFCVSAPVAGTYTLAANVEAPSQSSDSFYVRVGGAEPVTWHIPNGVGLNEREVRTVSVNPAVFTLNEGGNIVRFYHRETGTALSDFRFTATPRNS